jgi:hypothetical protein
VFISQWIGFVQPILIDYHNLLKNYELSATFAAIPWLAVDMVGDFCVSPIVPASETLCA